MASGWMRAAASALKLSHAAGTAAGNAAQAAVTSASNNRVSRGARHGIPGPWDAPPPPGMGTHGYWDYRGVARPSGIAPFSADFPLGRYREPRRWTAREEIGRAAVQSTNTGGSSLKSIKDPGVCQSAVVSAGAPACWRRAVCPGAVAPGWL